MTARKHRPSRHERHLYRYRPEDPTTQDDDRDRLKARREQELRAKSHEWDASLRASLSDRDPIEAEREAVVERRRRLRRHRGLKRLLDDLATILQSARHLSEARGAKRPKGGTHRRGH
jgi:hypothetical protein